MLTTYIPVHCVAPRAPATGVVGVVADDFELVAWFLNLEKCALPTLGVMTYTYMYRYIFHDYISAIESNIFLYICTYKYICICTQMHICK